MALVYSCCFWFSLRLGGILIGLFSTIQAVIVLIICGLARRNTQEVVNEITRLSYSLNVETTANYIQFFMDEPDKCITICITVTCIYIIICLAFIYGAYLCNNILMITYIVAELLRLIMLSALILYFLLLLKQNTMDIGLLIGASVASGFILLGMFYLWICAANLPILINEMERDEQLEKINKLQKLIEMNNRKNNLYGINDIPYHIDVQDAAGDLLFRIRNKRPNRFHNTVFYHS